MGHQSRNHKESKSNYPSGDNSGGQTYLSLLPRVISSGIIVFSSAFLVSLITASIVTPVQNSDATAGANINVNTTNAAYYVNIASNNGGSTTISKDIQTTAAGTIGMVTDNLRITSNTPNGYYIYVSMANATNGQKLVNTTDGSYFLNPIDITTYSLLDHPGNLGTVNTWGVAVADMYNSLFDSASSYASDGAIDQTTKFAPVPAYGQEQRLITRTGDTRSAVGTVDSIPVYYGYYANSALPSGTYSNTVLYTAYAEATETDGGVALPTGDLDYENGGNLTITTSLYTDRTIVPSQVNVKINDKNCPVASVTKIDAGTNDTVRITCTAPTQDKPGYYPTRIKIEDYGFDATANVFYDTPGIVIVSGSAAGAYKTMQSMTTAVCNAWDGGLAGTANWDSANNRPKAYTTTTQSPVYAYGPLTLPGTNTVVSNPQVIHDSNLNSTTLSTYWSGAKGDHSDVSYLSYGYIENINKNVPETYLRDSRDGNYYRIRKLADGSCWMTENLRLVFDRDGVNSVGVVSADGSIVAQNPVVTINENNSNVGRNAVGGSSASNFNASDFANKLAYTEKESFHSYWAAGSSTAESDARRHSTVSENNSSYHANYFARSYYNSMTRDDCQTLGMINAKNWTGSNYGDNCFIRDGDMQTIGTYYNVMTVTAGTGSNSVYESLANYEEAIMTDSICPAGWQLPNVRGSKSYANLVTEVYSDPATLGEMVSLSSSGLGFGAVAVNGVNADSEETLKPNNYDTGPTWFKTLEGYHVWAVTNQALIAPISMGMGGYYGMSEGAVMSEGARGLWYTSTIKGQRYGSNFSPSAGYLRLYYNDTNGYGFSARCVSQ